MKILVIGGNRFFGKKAAAQLVAAGHEVTLLNRQSQDDELGTSVRRIQCDRKNVAAMAKALENTKWDIVYDQVCFEASDARAACTLFQGKTPRYIFTSSQSVYKPGKSIVESAFDPLLHEFSKDVTAAEDYAEAKRQCEAVFFSQGEFETTAVRFPLVVGPDDYTGRLKWHVDRIKAGQKIYFPNIDAQVSLIHSTDAGSVLSALSTSQTSGPLNVCSPEPIRLRSMIDEIERCVGREVVLAEHADDQIHSPFGIESDWYMSTAKLSSLGIEADRIETWLGDLIEQVARPR